MDIAREYGGRLEQYRNCRRSVRIGIFGSFHRYEILESLRDHLAGCGYDARLSTDLAESHPLKDGEDPDAFNFRISLKLIDESSICIFVVFCERPGETNINQSVSQEAQHLYETLVSGSRKNPPRVLVLLEDGSEPAGLFRGLVESTRPRWNEAPFSSEEELMKAARQFCGNGVGVR